MSLPFSKTTEGLMVIAGYKSHVVRRDNPAYRKLVACVNSGDEQQFLELINSENLVNAVAQNATNGKLSFKNGKLYLNGNVLDNRPVYDTFNKALSTYVTDGLDTTSLLNFIEKLLQNPSMRSVEQLYNFLVGHGFTITEDGDFLAYKCVTSDFKDKHTRKIDNHPGQSPEMERNLISDDPDVACHEGLHVGALGYSGPNGYFYANGDRIVVVKVNPKDVVCVPKDCSFQKVRVCKYTVLHEYTDKLQQTVYNNNGTACGVDKYEGQLINNIWELNTGDEIVFEYNNEVRHAVYHDTYGNNHISTILMSPEPNEGEYRTFLWNKMSNCKVIG